MKEDEHKDLDSAHTQLKARIQTIEDTLIIHEKQIDHIIKKIDGIVNIIQKNII
jgi:chaperonin cofactor prefoldin